VTPVAACRQRENLARGFSGEVRAGDLLDPLYRRAVVEDIDVVCHAGTWASMWNHAALERERFYEPARDLVDQAVAHGVKRFIQASTVAIAAVARNGQPIDDFSPTRHTGFWPHLDRLIDLDAYMHASSQRGTQMVTLRLGHFIGAGNRLGLVPALVPRLKTRLVPWLAGGKNRLPLVAGSDLGHAFARAALADKLDDYESFNICGTEFPTLRAVIEYIASVADCPTPLYSVPYPAGYLFGWLMEMLKPVLPGSSPFLTRSIVHLCENWVCATDYARNKIGYSPAQDWRSAVREHLADLATEGYPWPQLRGA
jgi:2-alkyl-3-oxoalkanoate reductase